MSLYHLSRTVIKRSAGNSACKALSYIHRTKIRDEYFDKTYSFHSKEGETVDSKLHLPDSTPSSIRNLLNADKLEADVFGVFAQLIEGAENNIIDSRCKSEEKRENMKSRMQTGFMEVVALQKELTLEQNREILDQYIEEVYISRNLIVSSAIHFEEDNPHAHLFVSLRSISKEGFSTIKEREVMTRTSLKNFREAWARLTNEYFKSLGLENRISHQSFESLGINVIPTIHEGDARYTTFSEGIVETNKVKNEAIKQRNRELLESEPQRLLPMMLSKRVTFNKSDLMKEFARYFSQDLDQAEKLVSCILDSDEVVKIRQVENGEAIYTSRDYLNSQEALLEGARNLSQTATYGLDKRNVEIRLNAFYEHFSNEQKEALYSTTDKGSLKLVIGKAGSGKSTLMKAVAESYQKQGYRVFGGAWSGAAAEDISQTVGIQSRTLLSWYKKWEKFEEKAYSPKSAGGFFRSGFFLEDYKLQLNHKSVFILDEAGTVDVEHVSRLLTKAHAVGAKVILVGDSSQTRPIGPGEAFRALCARYEASELKEVKRQAEPWMRMASEDLSEYNVSKGIEAYDSNGCLLWSDKTRLHKELANQFMATNDKGTSQIAIAHRNEDVFQLNALIHTKLKESNQLGKKSMLVKTQTAFGAPVVEFTEGDRILFLRNDHTGRMVRVLSGKKKGITNGSLGTILRLKHDSFKVRLDDERIVELTPSKYTYLSHGYAITINKAQGKTFDRSYVLINSSVESADTYVALTRHRNECHIFANQSKFKDKHELVSKISGERAIDFIDATDNPKIERQAKEKLSYYDRDTILARIGIRDVTVLMEAYTPFRHNPKASKGDTLVFSSSGQGTSVQVTLKSDGPLVHNFKDGFGSDLIGFLGHYCNRSYAEMCKNLGEKYALETSMAAQLDPSMAKKPEVSMKQQVLNDINRRKKQKSVNIEKIKLMLKHTQSPEDSIVKRYLNKRGIYKSLPEDIRCQQSDKYGPSMVVIVRGHDGQITGIQRTRLCPVTNDKVLDGPAKLSQGCIFGSSVLIQKGNNSTVFLAEGVETALSLREAGVDGEIRAVLGKGNLLNVGLTVTTDRDLVLVADNDGKPWEEDPSMVNIVNSLKESQYNVRVIFPDGVDHGAKLDFNDIIRIPQGHKRIQDITNVAFMPEKNFIR